MTILLLPAVAFACGPTFGFDSPSWPSWLSDFSFNVNKAEFKQAKEASGFKALKKGEKKEKMKQLEKKEKKQIEKSGKKKGEKTEKKNINLAGPGMVLASSTTTLTIKDKNGTEVILLLTPETKLRYRGAKAEPSDFEVGDSIRFVAHKNDAGTWEAKKILNHSLRRAVSEDEEDEDDDEQGEQEED